MLPSRPSVHQPDRQRTPAKPVLVLVLRAPVWNAVAGVAVCANMLGRVAVPVKFTRAPQPPQHVGSKADGMTPTAASRGCASISGIAQPSTIAAPANENSVNVCPSPQVRPCLTMSATTGFARRNARDRCNMICLERVLHSYEEA